MKEFVTIPKDVWELVKGAAQSFLDDLSSGIKEGIYDDGEDLIEPLQNAINTESVTPEVYILVEGGNIQGASGNMAIGFNLFDKDNFEADEDADEDDLDDWNTMIEERTEKGTLIDIY